MWCELWVNGSFLTEKPEPSDLDVIVKFDYDVTLNLTADQKTLETIWAKALIINE